MSSLRWLLPLALCLCCGVTSGCAVTRKSASYDNQSKMPWFGLELATPRKSPAPETHRIRLEGSIPLEPEPAKLVMSKPRKAASKRLMRNDAAEVRGPIPIPRTDISDAPQPALYEGPDMDEVGQFEF